MIVCRIGRVITRPIGLEIGLAPGREAAPKVAPSGGRGKLLEGGPRACDATPIDSRATARGRRVRDRILSGQTNPSEALKGRHELANMILFLGDDLRESALAVGGIESFLLRAQRLLENPKVTPEELRALVDDDQVVERIDLLWDALSSLRRSMGLIHDTLKFSTGTG